MLMPITQAAAERLLAAATITNPASRVQRNRRSGARRGLWRCIWLGDNWNA